jgi:hypothetical protein
LINYWLFVGYLLNNYYTHGAANMRLNMRKKTKIFFFWFRRVFMVAQLIGD